MERNVGENEKGNEGKQWIRVQNKRHEGAALTMR
jgi:hypothetical protein